MRASFVAPELNSELQFYGDIFGCRPTRTVTFEVRVVMHYVGKVFLGDACMGELRGYINVPKIRHDTMNEVGITVVVRSESCALDRQRFKL